MDDNYRADAIDMALNSAERKIESLETELTQVRSELEIRKTNNLQEMENHHKMYLKAKELNQSLTQVRSENNQLNL